MKLESKQVSYKKINLKIYANVVSALMSIAHLNNLFSSVVWTYVYYWHAQQYRDKKFKMYIELITLVME